MKAAVRIGSGVTVRAGDELVHSGDGTARPIGVDQAGAEPFARVLSPEVVGTHQDGSFRVQCEMFLRRSHLRTDAKQTEGQSHECR